MHLGAENSILTNLDGDSVETDTSKASNSMIKMVECLKDVISNNKGIKKPTLVLNGDIIELALTTTNNAAMAFQRFIELVMPDKGDRLFDNEIFFMAGNHDHNLWERSRVHHYDHYISSLETSDFIEDEWHCTNLFEPEQIPVSILNTLLHRYPHLQDVKVVASYPAHALLSEDKQKCVVISHGHYVESMYSLMTSLRAKIFPDREKPKSFEELESENFGWVDFFWSTLGRSGSVGKDINLIYDKLQDPEQVKILIGNIAESFSEHAKTKVGKWVEKNMLQELLTLTLGKLASNERNEPDVELTPDATNGLKVFLEQYILNHLKKELDGFVPPNMTFIFGHTHKPFHRLVEYEGYPNPVKVYNSGGWVVDTMKQQPLHGASIVLVDEHLDVISLQMYKEGKSQVTLEEVKGTNQKNCDFYQRINQSIDMQNEPWTGFANEAQKDVELRYRNLSRIASSGN
ncbi:MAG: hypothetical protein R2852_05920 [Bacteroidia bacterium]